MFKYELKRLSDNKTLAVKQLQEDIENPWADIFARNGLIYDREGSLWDASEAIIDEDSKEEIEPAREKNYEIIKEDITQKLAEETSAIEQRAQDKLAAEARIKEYDPRGATVEALRAEVKQLASDVKTLLGIVNGGR